MVIVTAPLPYQSVFIPVVIVTVIVIVILVLLYIHMNTTMYSLVREVNHSVRACVCVCVC